MPLWLAVIESRARHEWRRLDLHLAAELLRLVDDLDKQAGGPAAGRIDAAVAPRSRSHT